MDETAQNIRVLLVDDQALVRTGLEAWIHRMPLFTVVGSAGSLLEALALAVECQPDLVLFDILNEPGLFAGVNELVRVCPRVVVVMLDDAPRDAHVREALRLGVGGYLTKQQPPEQIEAALRHAVSGMRVFAPEIACRVSLSGPEAFLAFDHASPLSRLTPREMEVLVCLAEGQSVKQCAKSLGIGTSTAGNHKSRLMKKLSVHKSVELARFAIHQGLIPKNPVCQTWTENASSRKSASD